MPNPVTGVTAAVGGAVATPPRLASAAVDPPADAIVRRPEGADVGPLPLTRPPRPPPPLPVPVPVPVLAVSSSSGGDGTADEAAVVQVVRLGLVTGPDAEDVAVVVVVVAWVVAWVVA